MVDAHIVRGRSQCSFWSVPCVTQRLMGEDAYQLALVPSSESDVIAEEARLMLARLGIAPSRPAVARATLETALGRVEARLGAEAQQVQTAREPLRSGLAKLARMGDLAAGASNVTSP